MTKTMIMLGAMSPIERRMGRYMRNPEGHGDAPPPAPAEPAAEPAPEPAADPSEVTAESLEAEFAPTPEGAVTETDPSAAEPKQEQNSVEERIGEMTAAQRAAERDAAEARREAEAARRDADELRRKYEPPTQEAPSQEDAAPDPNDYEYGEADSKFIADTARFHARQEFQTQQIQAEFRAEMTAMDANWKAEIAKPEVAEKYPDFHDVVVKGADEGKWDCSPLMTIGIKQSPVGYDVAHHLASNPEESRRIAGLSYLEQAREFGRLEGKYLGARESAAAEKPQSPAQPSKAPPPPENRARGAGGQFAVQPDTEDFRAFDRFADGVLKNAS